MIVWLLMTLVIGGGQVYNGVMNGHLSREVECLLLLNICAFLVNFKGIWDFSLVTVFYSMVQFL